MTKKINEANICHVTSSHRHKDIRIYWRECVQIRQHVKSITIVAPAPQEEITDEHIRIIPFSDTRPSGWGDRIRGAFVAAQVAESVDADLYHFHDVELVVPMSLLASRTKKPVVFDVHEHYRATIAQERGIVGRILALVYDVIERWALRKFAGVVSVTPTILALYQKRVKHLAIIRNFADVDNIMRVIPQLPEPIPQRCFFSGTMPEKSLFALADAFVDLQDEFANIEVHVAGGFDTPEAEAKLEQYWAQHGVGERLKLLGFLPHKELLTYASKCDIGLVLFWPWENVKASEPNKIFEYMAIGLPLVVPNSENYKDLLAEARCGVWADTDNGQSIANAIRHLLTHPDESAQMRISGRKAAKEKYQMALESPKLLELYENIFDEQYD